jgi:hypothetical protein
MTGISPIGRRFKLRLERLFCRQIDTAISESLRALLNFFSLLIISLLKWIGTRLASQNCLPCTLYRDLGNSKTKEEKTCTVNSMFPVSLNTTQLFSAKKASIFLFFSFHKSCNSTGPSHCNFSCNVTTPPSKSFKFGHVALHL